MIESPLAWDLPRTRAHAPLIVPFSPAPRNHITLLAHHLHVDWLGRAATFEADIMPGPARWSGGARTNLESAKAWVLAQLREQGVRLADSVGA